MFKKIFFGVALLAGLAACDGDYNDWKRPQTNDQGPVEESNLPIVAQESYDFTNMTDEEIDTTTIALVTPQPHHSFFDATFTYGEKSVEVPLNLDGTIATKDFIAAIKSICGPAPTEREVTMKVIGEYKDFDGKILRDMNNATLKVKLKAPFIDTAYYYVGTVNNWDNTNTDYKFSHSGEDVYEDPIFTIFMPAPYDDAGNRVDNWFKLFPQSSIGTWDGNVLGAEKDGDTALEGRLIDGGNAINMPATDGASSYTIELNLLERTYKITPLVWQPYAYLPGDANGWSFDKDILLGNGNGQFEGYAVLGGEWGWKVSQYPDWDHTDYGDAGEPNKLVEKGGNIMQGSTATQYFVKVDLDALTYDLTEVTAISLIGEIRGAWDTDVDLTPDLANRCWTVTADLNAGKWKFRVNHDWQYNFGGSYGALYQGGSDMTLEEAGNYTITLWPTYDGNSHCTVVKN